MNVQRGEDEKPKIKKGKELTMQDVQDIKKLTKKNKNHMEEASYAVLKRYADLNKDEFGNPYYDGVDDSYKENESKKGDVKATNVKTENIVEKNKSVSSKENKSEIGDVKATNVKTIEIKPGEVPPAPPLKLVDLGKGQDKSKVKIKTESKAKDKTETKIKKSMREELLEKREGLKKEVKVEQKQSEQKNFLQTVLEMAIKIRRESLYGNEKKLKELNKQKVEIEKEIEALKKEAEGKDAEEKEKINGKMEELANKLEDIEDKISYLDDDSESESDDNDWD